MSDIGDIVAAFSATPEDILLAHIELAWPHLSLDDQRRWCLETNYSKNPCGASEELQQTVQNISFGIAQWEERYGDYNRFMATPPRSHNGAPYRYEYSTFERCARQGELFDCALGRAPEPTTRSEEVVTAILGPNGPAWREQDYCVYVADCTVYGRGLIIQSENNLSYPHIHIRLRDDVSNEEALRLGQALLQAIAAPPEPWEGD
jgi:hypothetical protein